MIGTVTLNPCIDRTCQIKGLSVGGMNRMVSDRRDVSGKGINVSLALAQNGLAVRTCGFIYKEDKEVFLSSLSDMGVTYQGIEVDGRTRENIKLWNSDANETTEINQGGSYVPPESWEAFKSFFGSFVEDLELIVLSGSVPKGLGEDAYRQLILIADGKGVPSILDAEGPLLKRGLEAHPFLIKPNLYEFNVTFGPGDEDLKSIATRAGKIIMGGLCDVICVTMGKDGALMVSRDEAWFSPSPAVDVKCTQGAGDSIVAGICKAYSEGKGLADMLRYGVAMAGGTLSREGTLMCREDDFRMVLPAVGCTRIT